MKQEIKNPFKVNYKLYIYLFLLFFVILVYSIYLYRCEEHILIAEILKNLSISSIASIIVALFLEISNVKEKNKKVNSTYVSIYSELRYGMIKYVETWAILCLLFDKSRDYQEKKYTWKEWYVTFKKYTNSNETSDIIEKIKPFLKSSIEYVNKSLTIILSQQQLLEIHDVFNNDMKKIINDFNFEFKCAEKELDMNNNIKDFWEKFDALNKYIFNYIYNWGDIRFLNYLKFKPYEILDDKKEILKALVKSSSNL